MWRRRKSKLCKDYVENYSTLEDNEENRMKVKKFIYKFQDLIENFC